MDLSNISWPVYELGKIDIQSSNNLLYYIKKFYNKDTELDYSITYIIDDKSIHEPTLGKRRLKIIESEHTKLHKIRRSIYFLVDLIKLAKVGSWFIDNKGTIFQYTKHRMVTLKCYNLKNVLPGEGLGVYIEVEGISQRFKLLYRPTHEEIYVGLLHYNHTYILYGLYKKPFKQSNRKI